MGPGYFSYGSSVVSFCKCYVTRCPASWDERPVFRETKLCFQMMWCDETKCTNRKVVLSWVYKSDAL